MLLKVLFVVACAYINCAIKTIQAHDCVGTKPRPLTLCEEFQTIRDLAPRDSVIRLVQSHMENDIRFRKAVKYMQSSEFKRITANIDTTATYQSLLRPFVIAGINTTDINSVFKIFDCILIPVIGDPEFRSSPLHPEQLAEVRSLDTFAQEVSRLIPTNQLFKTLSTQIAENKQFAKFYEIVRKPSFRAKVMQGFTNRDVSRSIKTLRRQQIDLYKLVEYGLNVLSLGPEV